MFARTATRTARNLSRALSTAAPSASSSMSPALAFAALGAAALASSAFVVSPPASCDEAEVLRRLANIEGLLSKLGAAASETAQLELIKHAKVASPDMLMAKHFDAHYYNSLSDDLKRRLLKCCKSGAENADSGMGVYAMYPDDYDVLKEFMDKVIREYHKIPGEVKHITNWNLDSVKDRLPAGGKLDLTKLGLGVTSMRVRVGRNLNAFPLPGAMSKEDRINMEVSRENEQEDGRRDYASTAWSLP